MTEVSVLSTTDKNILFNKYGFQNNRISVIQLLRLNVSRDIIVEAGKIEGSDRIDSDLELFTALRYGGVRLTAEAQRAVDRILPPGPEGDKILAAAWLERRQKDQISEAEVGRALAFISSRSHISVAALRSHYRQTMESRLTLVARGEFPTGTPLPDTIRPLINYVATFDGRGNLRVNDQALFNDLVSSVGTYHGRNTPVYAAYMNTINEVSTNLCTRIGNHVIGNQISMMSPLNNNGRVVAQDIRAGR